MVFSSSSFPLLFTTYSCTTMITNINIPQLSLDTYIALGLVIATPWLYYLFSPYNSPSKFTTRDQVLSFLLLVHTLYTLHQLLVAQPPNIFKSLDLPPNTAPDYLRETLVERLGGAERNVTGIPPYLDTLLKRLGSMDARSLYFRYVDNLTRFFFVGWRTYLSSSPLLVLDMRFLQHVLIVSRSTIMLFTLFLYRCWNIFGKLDSLEYVSFISHLLFLDSNIDLSHQALTLPTSPKAHLRPLGLGTLTALLMFEAYNTLTIQFVIPPLGDNSKMLMVKTFLKSFFSPVLLTKKKKNISLSYTMPSYKRDTSFFCSYL